MNLKLKSIFVFAIASFGLLLLNVIIVGTLSKSLSYAFSQFWNLKLFLVPIAITFGFQAVLHYLIKNRNKLVLAGSGALNTGTMAACCTHHVSELIPFLALGGVSSFLIINQTYILAGALILNLGLVVYLYKKLRGMYEN